MSMISNFITLTLQVILKKLLVSPDIFHKFQQMALTKETFNMKEIFDANWVGHFYKEQMKIKIVKSRKSFHCT